MNNGHYYLHTSKNLIFKHANYPVKDIEESSFSHTIWEVDVTNRGNAWCIAIEAAALGADPKRIQELIETWELTDVDALNYLKYLHIEPTSWNKDDEIYKLDLTKNGVSLICSGNTWFEVLACLAKTLKYEGGKPNNSFEKLLHIHQIK